MKRTICIFLVGLLLVPAPGYSQRRVIDSLKQLLNSAKQDSSRSLLLEQLSNQYNTLNVDTAVLLAEQGLELARKIKFVTGEERCLSSVAYAIAAAGNDAKGLQLSIEALRLAESINDQRDIVRVLLSIGVIYSRQQDYSKSLQYRLLAKDLAISLHDEYGTMIDYLDLGADYENLKRLDSAEYYSEKSYSLGLKLGDKYTIGSALESLGDISSKTNLDSVAVNDYRMSIPICIEANDYDDYCLSTIGLARIFKKHGVRDSALYFAKISYSKARQAGLTLNQLRACSFLADFYKDCHKTDSAFTYLSEVVAIKDSLFNLEKARKMQTLTIEETMRQQEIAAQKIKAQDEHVKDLQLLGIGIFIPIFFVVVLILSRTKVKPRVVEFLGILSLLLVFEFITDLIFPYLDNWTNESPAWEMLILVLVAALLEPVNNRLEHWVKRHLVRQPVASR
jgi:tetratricopeptide (TPR) repeat protein